MKMNKIFGTLMAIAALTVAFTSCKKDTDVIKLKIDKMTLEVLESYKIPVEKASGTIVWSSSDILIASVSEEGEVLGISEGECIITATVGSAKANVAVTVANGEDPDEAPDLEKPADGKLQVVIQIPAGSECHGIALKGTFDGDNWSGEDTYLGADGAATPVDGAIYQFAAVEGYPNWYQVIIPATEALQFKVCLIYAGDGSWDGQAENVETHPCDYSTVDNSEMSGEGQCMNLGANGGLLYLKIGGWRKSECVVEEELERVVTVRVPECGFEIPSIVGSFNGWDATAIPMNPLLGGDGFTFTATVTAVASDEFKFAGSVSGWGNEIQMYDTENDAWNGLPNTKFGAETTFNFDFSDPDVYRWVLCAADSTAVE